MFAAIGAVLSEHSEGVITAIDREDDRDEYEVDVVVANEVIEANVLADGTIREDDRTATMKATSARPSRPK